MKIYIEENQYSIISYESSIDLSRNRYYKALQDYAGIDGILGLGFHPAFSNHDPKEFEEYNSYIRDRSFNSRFAIYRDSMQRSRLGAIVYDL